MSNPLFKSRHCYWCGSEVLPGRVAGWSHPQCQTIDHVRSKPECGSKEEYRHRDNKVLACYSCNQRRSQEWVMRERAGLVHRTDWSVKVAEQKRLRLSQKKQCGLPMLQPRYNCVQMRVVPELSAAWEQP